MGYADHKDRDTRKDSIRSPKRRKGEFGFSFSLPLAELVEPGTDLVIRESFGPHPLANW